MTIDHSTQQAIRNGRIQANKILALRKEVQERRAAALRKLETTRRKAAIRRRNTGVLVAEGDSWFDYPFHDILKVLQDDYAYDVESVAHHGDIVEDMAYTGQLEEFTSRLEKLLRNTTIPKAVLLSGGGNDLAGSEFHTLLNHALSAHPGFNASIVKGVIDQRLRDAYITILSQLTRLCAGTLGRTLPILVHGYDYPVPDGRGFAGGFWFLPGPWLEPGLRRKGYLEKPQYAAFAAALIDRFNKMLHDVTKLPVFPHVSFIDLRGTLSNGPDYKKWWANELHPTPRGFQAIGAKFAEVLKAL